MEPNPNQPQEPTPSAFVQPPQSAQPSIDFQKIIASFTTPDWLIVGGALVVFIASFLPWYQVSYNYSGLGANGNYSASASGWTYWPGIFAALVALATIAYVGVKASDAVKLPTMSFPEKYLYMGAGVLVVLLSLIYLTQTSSSALSVSGFSSGPSIGLFLALLAGIAIAAGGYLKPNAPVA